MSDDTPARGPQRPRGRPAERPMPERIPDTGANILRAVLRQPPRREDEWDYLKGTREADA